MKLKNKIISLTIIFLLGTTFILSPLSSAGNIPCTVRGYVYINGEITKPDNLELIFPSQNILCSLFNDGYYIADFSSESGETGHFICNYQGTDYQAHETITIQNGVYIYRINLTIITSTNVAPYRPINPNPKDNEKNVSINPILSVYVNDTDDDYLDVRFYDSENNLINETLGVKTGSRASIIWPNLLYNTTYNWYAVSEDENGSTNQSDIFSFKTEKKGINHKPYKPTSPTPENNSENINLNPELGIYIEDPDKDLLKVEFYNSSDHSVIDTLFNVESGTYVKATWEDLSFNKSYSWYVIVNDSEYQITSEIYTFKTKQKDEKEPEINITFPKKGGIYYKNKIYLEEILKDPLIIGNITIIANASDDSGIDRVEFYIYSFKDPKGTLLKIDEKAPYTFNWKRENISIMHLYVIRAKVYDNSEKSSFDEVIVRKFF